MNNEESIFAEALAKGSGADRAAFLEAACGDDASLRCAVEALLIAHHRAGGVLEMPMPDLDMTRPLSDPVGTMVGPYKLLEQIGAGGMGVVYMAEQLRPARRRISLKIIKPGMDSRQVIARFEAERQALAPVDHPNIAQCFHARTTHICPPYL